MAQLSPSEPELSFHAQLEAPIGEDAIAPLWQWQSWQGLPFVTCRLLSAWPHGFFTRSFAPRPPQELVAVLEDSASVWRVKQVHGNRVMTPAEISQTDPTPEEFPPADGIVSDDSGQSVWVCSADCTPVLMGDTQTGRVAALHAGWRGTATQIVPEAIARFLAFGSQLENLRFALGPAINGEVYQVSTQVAAQVGASVVEKDPETEGEEILNTLQQLANPPILSDPHPDRVRLDVRRIIQLQLIQQGIQLEQIAIAPHCTHQDPENFFSYRRDKQKNIQWSGMISH